MPLSNFTGWLWSTPFFQLIYSIRNSNVHVV
uniref:Uncharacterized protein n=1 Tax=Anguilla anguilla TaxID=7936 RepID=A0A0E9Q338_ANGAN